MEAIIDKYKGIHPGLILERELNKRKLKKAAFAASLPEYPQTINDITKGKRGLTAALALKIDKALGFEEGTMFLLQAFFEIKKEQQKDLLSKGPDTSILRKILFWDTDISKIDWKRQYRSVITRIFERGNTEEKAEILNFYGENKVLSVIGTSNFNEEPLRLASGNDFPVKSHKK